MMLIPFWKLADRYHMGKCIIFLLFSSPLLVLGRGCQVKYHSTTGRIQPAASAYKLALQSGTSV